MNYESDQLNELYTALAKTQMEMRNALKDGVNNYFKSRYATYESIISCSRPYLVKNGLAVLQIISTEGESSFLITRLGHSSGQWIQSKVILKPIKGDPQSFASYITYMRRYTYSALFCIVDTEDDDGEKAMESFRDNDDGEKAMESFRDEEKSKTAQTNFEPKPTEINSNVCISERQVVFLKEKLGPDKIGGFLKYYKINDLSNLPRSKFEEVVKKLGNIK